MEKEVSMCGIIGQYCFKGQPDKELIKNMSKILTHRGPDTDGTYFNNTVGLAHRRLGIIDLSTSARQPMFNEDHTVVVTYNGEIYNHPYLRSILIDKGHIFKSNADTEIIVHAYEEWGINCLTQFNGMWAFALWDNRKKVLFCARDRFGIKPFYYSFVDNSIIFASEIKALLAHPNIGTSQNELMVKTFLSSGILDHTHATMFDKIYQIPPSQGLIINVDGIKQFRYCDLEINNNITSIVSDDNVASNIIHLFKKAIKSHLKSDVPIGTCLSGGIDSSVIVKLVNSDHPMQNTFSAQFTDERFDETKYIKLVTANTSIEPFFIEPKPNELIKDIDHLIYTQDEPFGSLSIYAQYCVMKLAHGKVKVLLDGQGADELFGGYLAYQKNYISELIKRNYWILALKEILGSFRHHRLFYRYAIYQTLVRNKRKNLLTDYIKTHRYEGKFNTMLHNELFTTNLPSLLHFEDRNSMAFSIEARVPYLDTEFTNYIASLPYNQKIRNGVTKFALRNAIKGIIPERIRMRMDKMGFVTPEETWMKYELKAYITDIIYSTSFKHRGYWDSDKVIEDYQKFIDGKTTYSPEIWRIVCVELWARKFFDNRSILFSGIL
jgi:asparagine synthase (glutamine-hydrolysing)